MNKEELITGIAEIIDRIKNCKNPNEDSSESELGELLKDAENLIESVSVLKFIVNEKQKPNKIPSDTNSQEKLNEETEEKSEINDYKQISEESTLNEKISPDNLSLATKLEKQKISNLIDAIGINERFAFINELFDGNAADFNEALDILNSFSEHKAAYTYINSEIKIKYNWDEESQVVLAFLDLIEKRYVV